MQANLTLNFHTNLARIIIWNIKKVDLKILSKKYAIYHIGQNDKITLDEKVDFFTYLLKNEDYLLIEVL